MVFDLDLASGYWQDLASGYWQVSLSRAASLDDIISFGGTFSGALSNLTLIFERLRSYGLQLKSSKCHLFRAVRFGVRSAKDRGCEVVACSGLPEEYTTISGICGLLSTIYPEICGHRDAIGVFNR